MRINEISLVNELGTVKKVNTGIDMKAELAKRDAQISSPGTNPTLNTRTNVTRNSNSGTGASKKTFSKYISKTGDLGGTSLSTVNNFTSTKDGTTGTSTKRFVRPGGAGTQSVTDVGTGKTTNTKFQLKGPQSWAYDKPKLNASKKVKEGDMEADEKNPYAQPYIDEPEWKMLHDMDDDIIQAYVKHKKFRGRVTRMPTESEFKPHMMYDPKTGKGKMAKKEADHLKMKEKGWGHDKPIKEDGVIVPGVNTTADVKPGQTEKEAAKFGNGKIKPLMPKGKSNSHILFNLGLAESLIDKKLKEVDKDGDGKDDLAGFDAKTTYALKALQAKYPHADNLMSAMMAQTEQTLQNQYKGDMKRDELDKKHNDRFHELEKKLINIIKKNELKEGKKGR